MSSDELQIDHLLAAGLSGQAVAWPGQLSPAASVGLIIRRILYHGIAGLLADRAAELPGWPTAVLQRVREQAVAQAMWELRHRTVLCGLLAGLAEAGVVAILLKGTAVAYDLYPSPANRGRGDTDLLIAPADLERARAVLRQLGYRRDLLDEEMADSHTSQEAWNLASDGGVHHQIDLHWQLANAPALRDVLPFSECAASSMPLPRLCREARAMDRTHTLIHTCVHRAMHFTAPYFTDGVAYYGGDRLIWANDIDLLASVLSDAEWTSLCALAQEKGISAVCLDGLMMAQRFLGTQVPDSVRTQLGAAPGDTPASAYLLHSRQGGRAWRDFNAVPGLRHKVAYARALGFPSAAFLRGKYPEMSQVPLAILYARRVLELFRPSPGRSGAR